MKTSFATWEIRSQSKWSKCIHYNYHKQTTVVIASCHAAHVEFVHTCIHAPVWTISYCVQACPHDCRRDISQLQNAENQEHVIEPRQPTVTVNESALAPDAFLPSNKETCLQKQQHLLLSKLEDLAKSADNVDSIYHATKHVSNAISVLAAMKTHSATQEPLPCKRKVSPNAVMKKQICFYSTKAIRDQRYSDQANHCRV